MTENLIQCNTCNEFKDKKHFYHNKSIKSGLSHYRCKECQKKKDEAPIVENENTIVSNLEFLYPEGEYMTNLITGSTKSGKTYLLNDIFKQIHKQYDICILFSVNCHIDNYESMRKEGAIIFDKFDGNEKVINMLHHIQKKCNNFLKILVMIDDEIQSKHNMVLKNLMTTFRNSHFTTFVSLQSHIMLNKSSRNNCHRIICLKLNSNEELREFVEKMLYGLIEVPKKYKSKNDKLDYLCSFYRQHTENYNCFIIDTINTKIIYYKSL